MNDDGESWCTSAASYKDPLAVQRKWQEDHLKEHISKHAALDAEKKQKAVLEAKKKAAEEAEEAEAKATKAAAKAEWNRQVELARSCIALADPVKAINMLYDLSQDVAIIHHINQEAKKEVSQFYAALYNHWELQQLLTQVLAHLPDHSDNEESNKENNESSIKSSIGDTVKVNRSTEEKEEESSEDETGSATVVVDRLPPAHPNNETNHSRSSETNGCNDNSTISSRNTGSIGGDTVKVNRSTVEEDESRELETGSATVVVDRGMAVGTTNRNIPHRSTRASDGDKSGNKGSI